MRIDAHSHAVADRHLQSEGARNQSNSSFAKRSQAFDGPMPKKNETLRGKTAAEILAAFVERQFRARAARSHRAFGSDRSIMVSTVGMTCGRASSASSEA